MGEPNATTTTTPPPNATTTTTGDTASLRAARTQLAARTQELEQLRGEVEQLRTRADTADTLAAEVKRLKAEHQGMAEQHRTDRALWAAGLTDPDEIELVRFVHGRLPEKDRPPLTDWLEAVRKEPTKAPKLLEPVATRWKSSSSSTTSSSTTSSSSTTRKRANPNAGTVPVDGDGGSTAVTAEEWAEARRRALRGDGKLLDELRKRDGRPSLRTRRGSR